MTSNMVRCENSDGFIVWIEYDVRGNEVYRRDSKEFSYFTKFDKRNNVIYHEDSNGISKVRKFDENNLIYTKNNVGFETWREYENVKTKINETSDNIATINQTQK